MKYIHAMLAVVGLLVVGGAIGAARADARGEENEGVTLYTPPDFGELHICSAVNVSDKTLGVTFAILGNDAQALSCDSPTTCMGGGGGAPTTNPTPEFELLKGRVKNIVIRAPLGSGSQEYCAVAVSGTDNRDDVRVVHINSFTNTIPGTTIPTLVTRTVEGH